VHCTIVSPSLLSCPRLNLFFVTFLLISVLNFNLFGLSRHLATVDELEKHLKEIMRYGYKEIRRYGDTEIQAVFVSRCSRPTSKGATRGH